MSLLFNGLSGTIAAQAALDAASQNVANALTPGYTRQGAALASVGPARAGVAAGDGVVVSSLVRFSDGYKTQQLWRSNTMQGQHQVAQEYLVQLEQVLSDQKGSISAGLDGFFAALSAASVEPTSSPQRQAIVDSADALAHRFNSVRQVLSLQRGSVYQQRLAAVDQVNELTHDIALLNDKIAQTRATGLSPSDLLDQRDNKVDALAKLVGVQTVDQPDGGMIVSLRGGQPLVVGLRASTMQAVTQPDGTQTLEVQFGRERLSLDGQVLGGTLGGLNDYEDQVLQPMTDAVSDLAREFSTRVNGVLTSGFGVQGTPGQPLFVYDPTSSGAMLAVDTTIAPLDLGLSGDAAKPGDSQRLLELIDLPKRPIPVGRKFIFAFGATDVLHSPSLRARLVNRLSSTGWNGLTTQDGLATAEKSLLVAAWIQLSTLQEPTSEMSAASTA